MDIVYVFQPSYGTSADEVQCGFQSQGVEFDLLEQQKYVCRRFGATEDQAFLSSNVGVDARVQKGARPLHGLRCQYEGKSSGWFFWVGRWPEPEKFEVTTISSVILLSPEIAPYLLLAPGWRFTIGSDERDIAEFDATLLDSPVLN